MGEQRERLLPDPDPKTRWIFTTCAVDGKSPLTETTFTQLVADPSAKVRAEVTLHRDLHARHLVTLAADPEPAVRRLACRRAWPHLDPGTRASLLADPRPNVRTEAVLVAHSTAPMSVSVFAALPDDEQRQRAARECLLSDELAHSLAHSLAEDVRRAAAGNPDLARLRPHHRPGSGTRPGESRSQRLPVAAYRDKAMSWRQLVTARAAALC